MFNRAKIMQDACRMVRRAGNREALSVRLSRALRNAWQDAKEEAAVARLMAREPVLTLELLRAIGPQALAPILSTPPTPQP